MVRDVTDCSHCGNDDDLDGGSNSSNINDDGGNYSDDGDVQNNHYHKGDSC